MSEVSEASQDNEEAPEEKSFLRIIVHSFFIIPFLIAVSFSLLSCDDSNKDSSNEPADGNGLMILMLF